MERFAKLGRAVMKILTGGMVASSTRKKNWGIPTYGELSQFLQLC